jgi:phage FluMu gp28-like protein
MSNPLTNLLSLPTGDASNAPPVVLLPYQQEWIAGRSALEVMEKGRRTGVTWAEASDDVLTAASAASAGGQNVYYIAYNQDMTVEYIQACAMWAQAFNYAATAIEEGFWSEEEADRHIKTYTIRFPASGFRVVALSSRPSNLRGRQGVIVIDEAAFHEQLGELLKAALAMLIWGGRVKVISTHNGAANPFAELIDRIRAGKQKGVVHRVTFRDAVRQGLYRRVCLRKGTAWTQAAEDAWVADVYAYYGDGAAEELDCIPTMSGGTYLSLALIEARMAAPAAPDAPEIVRGRWTTEFGLQLETLRAIDIAAWCDDQLAPALANLNPKSRHALGEDFARIGDQTSLTIAEEGRDLITRVRLQIELGNCPFAQQRQILLYIVDRIPRFSAAAFDAGGNGAELAEFAADKWGHSRVEQIKLSDAFYLAQMPRFKSALEDATLDNLPRDDQCRDDLRALQKINGVPKLAHTKTQKGDGQKVQRHGDFAISLFLCHYAMTREGAPGACTGFVPMPRRNTANKDDDFPGSSRKML